MSRQAIRQRFDEIVEFGELTDAIERQVKFYSMGMQMRLGFSIAAFLEPDILLVDEVLAVGDANFQQKCLRRIGEVVRNGTTLIYVSHDLASVEASCERAIWLADAVVQAAGPTKEVVTKYRAAIQQNAALTTSNEGVVQVLKVDVNDVDGGQVRSEGDVEVRLTLNAPEAYDAELLHRDLAGLRVPHVHRPPQRVLSGRRLRDPVRAPPHPPCQGPLRALAGHVGTPPRQGQAPPSLETGDLLRGHGTRADEAARRGHGVLAGLRGGRLEGQLSRGRSGEEHALTDRAE